MRRRSDLETRRCGRASGRGKYAPRAARRDGVIDPATGEAALVDFDPYAYEKDSDLFDWIESDFDAKEFQEFLDAEPCDVEPDPRFVERLRRDLWWLILDRLLPGGNRRHHH